MSLNRKRIEEVVLNILGEDGLALVKELYDKQNISEFDLAKRANKDIKVIRKMLYLLYNQNLVGFTRKKDKLKGWYIYYWTLIPENIQFNYYRNLRDELDRLKKRQEDENLEMFFICRNRCVRLNFDQSMEFEFHCPECGELVEHDENKEEGLKVQQRVIEIEQELEQLKEKRKTKRKKVKELKKETKKKKIAKKKEELPKKAKVAKAKPVSKLKKILKIVQGKKKKPKK